jgi:two-component system, OmpR family, sensor kinase
MLRLARLDQAPDQQHDPVDLTALAAECALRAQLADPRRTWQTRIAADLVTVGDEELLRRAIDNLLANVHAHTPDDTVVTITAAAGSCGPGGSGGPGGPGGRVSVEVSDNGPGVPAGQLPRIFDRFYRAGAQSDCPGSGLGLAIVTAIATAHRGSAEAALNHPHGLRITLTLPVAGGRRPERKADPPAIESELHGSPRTRPSLSSPA